MTSGQKLGITIIILVLTAFYFVSDYIKNDIEKNQNFTIGRVTGYFNGSSQSSMLLYQYSHGGTKYDGDKDIDESEYFKYENRFFVIKYSSNNPSWSKILLSRPVTDTIAIKAAGFSLPKKKKNQFQEN